MIFSFRLRSLYTKLPLIILVVICSTVAATAQTYIKDMARQSARSDQRTGGVIESAEFQDGERDVKFTVNVPAFKLTLWQNGKEIKNYPIGVGKKNYPIFVGLKNIKNIIWNPVWDAPTSTWVDASLRGKSIKPTDSRNPLGKIKIPLGHGYLIHQAKGKKDLGNLVSHGCIRMMLKDLYDLNDKTIAARSLEVPAKSIKQARRTKKTFYVELDEQLPIEITYDTLVVEAGVLRVYPDVYEYKKNTAENLRKELEANNVDAENISDESLEEIISKAKTKNQYSISLKDIRDGNFLDGKIHPVLSAKDKR
ncbi:MAG: L,D-transpeptidase [Pyrinomonadaceae bacterium]|nr:L,D-transpeptidase [Pyrinomonadaceae bacterium]